MTSYFQTAALFFKVSAKVSSSFKPYLQSSRMNPIFPIESIEKLESFAKLKLSLKFN